MNSGIIELSDLELATQTKVKKNLMEITFNNEVFIRGSSFKKNDKEKAIQYCKKFAKNNTKILLVKGKALFDVWIQKKIFCISNIQEKKSDREDKINKSSEIIETNKNKSLKKYRGQVIPEQNIPNLNIIKKPRRKYRGQYID